MLTLHIGRASASDYSQKYTGSGILNAETLKGLHPIEALKEDLDGTNISYETIGGQIEIKSDGTGLEFNGEPTLSALMAPGERAHISLGGRNYLAWVTND